MPKIKLDLIEVGDRLREDFGSDEEKQEIIDSLKKFGLIQPVTIVSKSHIQGGDASMLGAKEPDRPFLLVAGERRLRAAITLGWTHINCEVKVDVTPEFLVEMEVEENLCRKAMTPAEIALSKQRIHSIMVAKGGTNKPHSIRATARILKESPSTTSTDLKIAQYVPDIPELINAQTRTEALSMITNHAKAITEKPTIMSIKESVVEPPQEPDSIRRTKDGMIRSYLSLDFMAVADRVPESSFNIVYSDLIMHDFNGEDKIVLKDYIGYCYKVLQDGSWMLHWIEMNDLPYWLDQFKTMGFRTYPGNLILWHHGNIRTVSPYFLPRTANILMYCSKGSAKLAVNDSDPIISSDQIPAKEIPIEVTQKVLRLFLKPRSKVLIPKARSGSSMLATFNLNGIPVGYGKDKETYTDRINTGNLGRFK